jgi:signal recognition particle receptor subunit beta
MHPLIERLFLRHLHQILHALTSLPPSIPPPPLLLFAHKTDLLSNPSSNANLAIDRVRTVLERELEKRRLSAVGGVGVEGLGSEGEGDVNGMGGLECSTKDGSFKFAEWEGGRVDFASGWVDVARHDLGNETPEEEKAGIDGLASLKDWISGL